MSPRHHPNVSFGCAVAAAALAVTAISGNARAEGPLVDRQAFVSSRSAAEVRAEALASRNQLSSAGHEWLDQQNGPQPHADSGATRAQARADFIGARDAVRWSNGEGGTAVMGGAPQMQRAAYPKEPGR